MNEELLRQIPLFESLSKDAREFIARRLKTETFAAGKRLLRQGDAGNSAMSSCLDLSKSRQEKNGTSLELAFTERRLFWRNVALSRTTSIRRYYHTGRYRRNTCVV